MNKLNKTYVIGTHVMFYEIEIFKEFIDGLINMLDTIENKENVYFDFCLNLTQLLEQIDTEKMTLSDIESVFHENIHKLKRNGAVHVNHIVNNTSDIVYLHADYRRDLNYKYCNIVDYVIWGETDSFIPREGLLAIDTLAAYTDSIEDYTYIMSFADRKMWDESWNATVHIDYESLIFDDGEYSHLNPNQAKSPMSIETMNSINSKISDFNFIKIDYTKIDGSFLVISSNLIKSGVSIPLCMLYNDDEGFAISYEQLYKNNIRQYICKNLLKVHARRHPKKRMYVKNENNEYSFNDKKGNAFHKLKSLSQYNLQVLRSGKGKFATYKDLKDII